MFNVENMLVGKRLKTIRREKGITIRRMCDVLKLSEGHYRKIEKGMYGLDVRKLLIIFCELDIDPIFLFTGIRIGFSEEEIEKLDESKKVIIGMIGYFEE